MSDLRDALTYSAQGVLVALSFLLGGLDAQLGWLLILCLGNAAMGLCTMRKRGEEFDREKALGGAITMMVYVLMIMSAVAIEKLFCLGPIETPIGISLSPRNALIMYFSLTEIASMWENAGLAGVRVPPVIGNAVKALMKAFKNDANGGGESDG